MPMRIGLSARDGAAPLLNTIGNRKRPTLKVPPALDDPPVSTDDEDELASEATVDDQPKSPVKQKDFRSAVGSFTSDFDSSGDDAISRADIKPTVFERNTRSTAKPKAGRGENKPKRRRVSLSPDREAPQPDPLASSGEHLKSKYGFVERKQAKATYGRRGTSSQSSQKEPASSQPQSRSSKLKIPSSIDSPQKKASKISIPEKNIFSSPEHWTRRIRTTFDNQESDGTLSPTPEEPKKLKKKPTRKLGKKKAASPAPSPPPAVFKMPTNFLDLSRGADGDNFPAKEGELSDFSTDNDTTVQELVVEERPSVAVCPWCGVEVDKAELEAFTKGRRLNVRLQTRFCQKHTKKTAKTTWQERGYPDIDWDSIESRFKKHDDFLTGIVNGAESHFRDILAKNVEQGKSRSLKKEENLNPGYYGARGFNVMCDYLVREYGDRLKTKAVEDRVIAGRGSAAFIQSVLVAELGVRLIMDDMGVGEDEARDILAESKALGEIVQDADS